MEKLKVRLLEEFGAESVKDSEHLKPIITNILKNSIVQPSKIAQIEENIDLTISELSEIYPIFAYELSGSYKIKEKLDSAEQYFQTISIQFDEEFPAEIKDWIKPKISTELILNFDEYIKAIAKKIGRKTENNVSEKLNPKDEIDISELDKLIEEYVIKIKKTMPNKVLW